MIKTVSELHHAISQHSVGNYENRWDPTVTEAIWNKLLHDRRMPKRRMTRRMSRKRGGASYELTGAPLDYTLTPGSAFTTNPAVAVYDRFPIDPTVNPQVVSDLDVFFGSALSRGCGIENSSLQVPADMGSNQVGGKRRRTKRSLRYRGGSNSSIATPGFFDKFQSNMGNLGDSALHHPYMSTARPTLPHSLTHQWQGRVDSIPTSADPTNHTWKYATEQPAGHFSFKSIVPSNFGDVGSLYNPTNNTGATTTTTGAAGAAGAGAGAQAGGRRRKSRKSRKGSRKYSKRH
jgi:hypothetical protein